MTCHQCGGTLQPVVTDMPFKIGQGTIVIVKQLPMLLCPDCGAYLLEDGVMQKVERILAGIDASAELEVVPYAA